MGVEEFRGHLHARKPFEFLFCSCKCAIEQGTHPEELESVAIHEWKKLDEEDSYEEELISICDSLAGFCPPKWSLKRIYNERVSIATNRPMRYPLKK